MKVLIAMDSFKGSLSSLEAGMAVKEGLLHAIPNAEVTLSPLADGGEGTVDALCHGLGGTLIEISVAGPLGENFPAKYGILPNGTAVIEIASAAGLPLIPLEKRNPLFTTTYGVGELIRDAIGKGCRDFLMGLGGSATNDGGVGMLSALGWSFLDRQGHPILSGAVGLKDLERIDCSRILPELSQCRFRVACDVTNPLLGTHGCSAVFAPQKGATAESIEEMDRWLGSYSCLVQGCYPTADPLLPGTGAAGGLGFAFAAFLGGTLEPGAGIVADLCQLEQRIMNSDMVITGEGRLDGQTLMGKGPIHIARLGKKYGKPVVALAGCIGPNGEKCLEEGITAYYATRPHTMSLQEGMKPPIAYENLKNTAFRIFASWKFKKPF